MKQPEIKLPAKLQQDIRNLVKDASGSKAVIEHKNAVIKQQQDEIKRLKSDLKYAEKDNEKYMGAYYLADDALGFLKSLQKYLLAQAKDLDVYIKDALKMKGQKEGAKRR